MRGPLLPLNLHQMLSGQLVQHPWVLLPCQEPLGTLESFGQEVEGSHRPVPTPEMRQGRANWEPSILPRLAYNRGLSLGVTWHPSQPSHPLPGHNSLLKCCDFLPEGRNPLEALVPIPLPRSPMPREPEADVRSDHHPQSGRLWRVGARGRKMLCAPH